MCAAINCATDFESNDDGQCQTPTRRRPVIHTATKNASFMDLRTVQMIWGIDGFNPELADARMRMRAGPKECMFMNFLCVFSVAGPHSDQDAVHLPIKRRLEKIEMLAKNTSIALEYAAICMSLVLATLAFVSRLDSDDTDGGAKESANNALEVFEGRMDGINTHREEMATRMLTAMQSACEAAVTHQTCATMDADYRSATKDVNFSLQMLIAAAELAGTMASAASSGINLQQFLHTTICRPFVCSTTRPNGTRAILRRLTGSSSKYTYTDHHTELLAQMKRCGVNVTVNYATRLAHTAECDPCQAGRTGSSLFTDAPCLDADALDYRKRGARAARLKWSTAVCWEVLTRAKDFRDRATAAFDAAVERTATAVYDLLADPITNANILANDFLNTAIPLCANCSQHKNSAKATADQVHVLKSAAAIAAHSCNNRRLGIQSCEVPYVGFVPHGPEPLAAARLGHPHQLRAAGLQAKRPAIALDLSTDVVEHLSALVALHTPGPQSDHAVRISDAMEYSDTAKCGLLILADTSRGLLRQIQSRAASDLTTIRDLTDSLVAGCTNPVVQHDKNGMDVNSIVRSEDGRSVLLPGIGAVSHIAGVHLSECSMSDIADLFLGPDPAVPVTVSPSPPKGGFESTIAGSIPAKLVGSSPCNGWSYSTTIGLFQSAIQELSSIHAEQQTALASMKSEHSVETIRLPSRDTWNGASPQCVYGGTPLIRRSFWCQRGKDLYHAAKDAHLYGCQPSDCKHHKRCLALSKSVEMETTPKNDFQLNKLIGIRPRPRRRLSAHAINRSANKTTVVPGTKDLPRPRKRSREERDMFWDEFDQWKRDMEEVRQASRQRTHS